MLTTLETESKVVVEAINEVTSGVGDVQSALEELQLDVDIINIDLGN